MQVGTVKIAISPRSTNAIPHQMKAAPKNSTILCSTSVMSEVSLKINISRPFIVQYERALWRFLLLFHLFNFSRDSIHSLYYSVPTTPTSASTATSPSSSPLPLFVQKERRGRVCEFQRRPLSGGAGAVCETHFATRPFRSVGRASCRRSRCSLWKMGFGCCTYYVLRYNRMQWWCALPLLPQQCNDWLLSPCVPGWWFLHTVQTAPRQPPATVGTCFQCFQCSVWCLWKSCRDSQFTTAHVKQKHLHLYIQLRTSTYLLSTDVPILFSVHEWGNWQTLLCTST